MTAIFSALAVVVISFGALLLVRAAYWNGFRDGHRTSKAQNQDRDPAKERP